MSFTHSSPPPSSTTKYNILFRVDYTYEPLPEKLIRQIMDGSYFNQNLVSDAPVFGYRAFRKSDVDRIPFGAQIRVSGTGLDEVLTTQDFVDPNKLNQLVHNVFFGNEEIPVPAYIARVIVNDGMKQPIGTRNALVIEDGNLRTLLTREINRSITFVVIGKLKSVNMTVHAVKNLRNSQASRLAEAAMCI